MCGLAGLVIGKKNRTKEDFEKIKSDFSDLMVATQVRGKHATGAFVLDTKSGITYFKAPVPAEKMVKTQGWADLLDNVGENTVAIIGHVRYATHGSPEENSNNHPIVMNNVIGVHNGVISNNCELCDKYPYEQEVDSAAIFSTIEAYAKKSRVSTESIAKALPELEGNFAIMLADKRRPNSIFVARDGSRPLVYHKDESEKLLWLSSTGEIMRTGLKVSVFPTMLPPYSVARLSVAHAGKARIKTTSWWTAPRIKEVTRISYAELAKEIKDPQALEIFAKFDAFTEDYEYRDI